MLILAELTAEIDAVTLDAYGWSRDLPGDAMMSALTSRFKRRNATEGGSALLRAA